VLFDPPYGNAHVSLYDAAAGWAARWLAPNGVLMAFVSVGWLDVGDMIECC
jgi:hypothetical protein